MLGSADLCAFAWRCFRPCQLVIIRGHGDGREKQEMGGKNAQHINYNGEPYNQYWGHIVPPSNLNKYGKGGFEAA